ncbi:ribosome biogenesis GTP-binding protein YihA/YsxC [Dokdonella sp.]|uniref:ribosome biogenesis GTP-binding protein YihA/YsxC n=1 Tax=Dokdonella sp. TaxID=2291710 RepID=UPI0025BC3C69|nr:ribosome biogenesis GTP-binding protein YihA/YsxC [Dokdonella sp.]MBX3691813.1 ribosome biogenesis GTP-binding protein YihA/YsxC [Dokdonella sp.]MCW5568705.1 ribosome biogenesis GTP-binding protein YihA/YsxC [Dokdonella sp.]
MHILHTVKFSKSANAMRDLPPDSGAEVAFAGRSNAGKSSALNALAAHKGLARVSKTPGRTQLINIFSLDDARRLVDLPGYGYAKVPVGVRDHWRELVDTYLKQRKALKGVVLIIDSRHPLKEFDRQMLAYAEAIDLPCHVVLTKSDKLSRSEAARTLALVRAELGADGSADARVSVQLFSATAKVGLDEARDVVMRWLGSA